jgi:hypothetical protein
LPIRLLAKGQSSSSLCGMETLTQASFLDEEIKLATAKINELVSTNASFSDIETAQGRLQVLLAERKDYLYKPRGPAHFFERVVSESLQEDRQRVASELEASVIEILLKLYKESEDIQGRAIPYEEQWQGILAFLRLFKHPIPPPDSEDADADDEQIDISWGNKPGLSIQELCAGLAQYKYLSQANAELLEYVLEDPKEARKRGIIIDWDGSKRSLATFLVVSQYLGILNPDKARPKMRDTIKDDFGVEKYPTPPIADIISRGFLVRGHELQNSDISRELQKRLIVELDNLKAQVEYLADLHIPGSEDIEDMGWDDLLSCLFTLRKDPSVDMVKLVGEYRYIDFSVLRFLHDYSTQYGGNREHVGPELNSFS